mmetsp:Transcript_8619/g.31861  ORF Transcript_8619/g.31861 Transcript_8619/m.31861 type:complete len:247 (+) Transcript_8619:2324-3064(+)
MTSSPKSQLHSLIETISQLQREYNNEMALQQELKQLIQHEKQKIEQFTRSIAKKKSELSDRSTQKQQDDNSMLRITDSIECDTPQHIASQVELEKIKLKSLESKYEWLKVQMREKAERIKQTSVHPVDLSSIALQARRRQKQMEHKHKELQKRINEQLHKRDSLLNEIQMFGAIEKEKQRELRELMPRETNTPKVFHHEQLEQLLSQNTILQQEMDGLSKRIDQLSDDIANKDASLEKAKNRLEHR